jgi:hypothetical protein
MAHILLDKREQWRKACLWITRARKLNNDSQEISPKAASRLR